MKKRSTDTPAPPTDRTVETVVSTDGSVVVLEWGWQRKSCRVTRNGRLIDLFYEGGGAVHGFHSGAKFATMDKAIYLISRNESFEHRPLIPDARPRWLDLTRPIKRED